MFAFLAWRNYQLSWKQSITGTWSEDIQAYNVKVNGCLMVWYDSLLSPRRKCSFPFHRGGHRSGLPWWAPQSKTMLKDTSVSGFLHYKLTEQAACAPTNFSHTGDWFDEEPWQAFLLQCNLTQICCLFMCRLSARWWNGWREKTGSSNKQ